MILEPSPPPPPLVRHALARLHAARGGNPADLAELGDLGELARPWDPATCSDALRHQLWAWCDAVAVWINRSYAWRPAQLIPACWPAHPHLAAELPVLACLRVAADQALTPDPLEEWHRTTLPLFLDRLADRLGESGCRTGTHIDWPAAARDAVYRSDHATAERARILRADTHPGSASADDAGTSPVWQRMNPDQRPEGTA